MVTMTIFVQFSILKISVCHLENPVEHGDIDSNVDYIVKTENLCFIIL
jgi:hypothetical protein